MTCARAVACLAVLALFGGGLLTQEPATGKGDKKPKKPAAAPADKKPATYKVEKQPFQIERTVKGVLAAEAAAEITYRPLPSLQGGPSQGPLTVRTIATHGARVKKGDVLVAFDGTKLDEALEDLEKEKKVLEAGIKLAEEELPLFEKSVPTELAAAEFAKKRADEDLRYFLDVGREQSVKAGNMMVKMAKFFVEYAEEELRQLEKMYKANDLTEETEKMILRRQQNYLEMERYWYQRTLIEHDYLMKYTLPNKEKALKETQIKQEQQLDKARKTLGPTAAQKRASLVKMRHDQEKHAQRLEKLKKDRAALTIHSPIDGVVYHGKFHKGHWTLSDALASKLAPHGTIAPDEVFLTVVNPRPVVVHLTIEEKDVHLIKPGAAGTARVLFNPDRKLQARVTKLATVPAAPGKYDAVVALDLGRGDDTLMPGMACSVKFVAYSKKDALVVPAKAVHEEGDKYVVHVARKDGKPQTREVTPGRTEGEQTEILSGLQQGEEILLERPGQQASKKGQGAAPDQEGGADQ
jgi:multidrug efflux pump subunit AcrA (membrane-fusion protein)